MEKFARLSIAYLDLGQIDDVLPADVGGLVVVLRRRRPPLGRRVDDPGRSQRPRRRLRRRRYALDRGVRLVLRVGKV